MTSRLLFRMVVMIVLAVVTAEVRGAAPRHEWKPNSISKGWLRLYVNGAPTYSFEIKTGSVKRYDSKTKKWSAKSPADVPRFVWDKMKSRGLVPLEDWPNEEGWRRTQIDGTGWGFNLEKGTINRREKTTSGKYKWKAVPSSKAPKELLTAMKTLGVRLPKPAPTRTAATIRNSIFPKHVLDRHKRIGGKSPWDTLIYLKEKCRQKVRMRDETGKKTEYSTQSVGYKNGELVLYFGYTGEPSKTAYIPLAHMDPTRLVYDFFKGSDTLLQRGGLFRKERWAWSHDRHLLLCHTHKNRRVIRNSGYKEKHRILYLVFSEKDTAQRAASALMHFIRLHGGKGEEFAPAPIRKD